MTSAVHDRAHRWAPRLLGALVTVCLAVTGLTVQSAQAAGTGSITGKVFTKAIGVPAVPATSVYIYLYRSSTADGDYDGVDSDPSTEGLNGFSFVGNTFNLTGLAAGYYKFEVAGVDDDTYQREYYNDAQYIYDATPIPVGSGVVNVADMELEPAGQISGRVTDESGAPLANASVSLQRTRLGGAFGVQTDANGYYSTGRPPNEGGIWGGGLVKGDYRVAARHDNYSDGPDAVPHEEEYWQEATSYGTATPVTVTPGQTTGSINFTLAVAPRIRLTVKDPAGNPIPHANVGIWYFYDGAWGPYQAGPNDTDANGIYRKTVRIGDRYKFFIKPPAGVGGVTEWYDNAYSEATAQEISATSHGQVINITIQLGAAPAPVVQGSTPKISGIATSGKTLTANPGTWGPQGVGLGYQWLANGSAISKATGSTFKLTNTQAGKRITVRVTGKLVGAVAVSKESAATSVVKGVLTTKKVSIAGTRKVGKKLRADTLAWGPKPVKLSYKWYRNGRGISGQSGRYYKLRNADKGKRISVRVYQRKTYYTTASKLSARTGKIKKR